MFTHTERQTYSVVGFFFQVYSSKFDHLYWMNLLNRGIFSKLDFLLLSRCLLVHQWWEEQPGACYTWRSFVDEDVTLCSFRFIIPLLCIRAVSCTVQRRKKRRLYIVPDMWNTQAAPARCSINVWDSKIKTMKKKLSCFPVCRVQGQRSVYMCPLTQEWIQIVSIPNADKGKMSVELWTSCRRVFIVFFLRCDILNTPWLCHYPGWGIRLL